MRCISYWALLQICQTMQALSSACCSIHCASQAHDKNVCNRPMPMRGNLVEFVKTHSFVQSSGINMQSLLAASSCLLSISIITSESFSSFPESYYWFLPGWGATACSSRGWRRTSPLRLQDAAAGLLIKCPYPTLAVHPYPRELCHQCG